MKFLPGNLRTSSGQIIAETTGSFRLWNMLAPYRRYLRISNRINRIFQQSSSVARWIKSMNRISLRNLYLMVKYRRYYGEATHRFWWYISWMSFILELFCGWAETSRHPLTIPSEYFRFQNTRAMVCMQAITGPGRFTAWDQHLPRKNWVHAAFILADILYSVFELSGNRMWKFV